METTWARANEVVARPPTIHSDQPRVTALIIDNYCVPQWCLVEIAKRTDTCGKFSDFKCKLFCSQPQKKRLSPMIVKQIKFVKGVSCADPSSSVRPVTNVHAIMSLLLKICLDGRE